MQSEVWRVKSRQLRMEEMQTCETEYSVCLHRLTQHATTTHTDTSSLAPALFNTLAHFTSPYLTSRCTFTGFLAYSLHLMSSQSCSGNLEMEDVDISCSLRQSKRKRDDQDVTNTSSNSNVNDPDTNNGAAKIARTDEGECDPPQVLAVETEVEKAVCDSTSSCVAPLSSSSLSSSSALVVTSQMDANNSDAEGVFNDLFGGTRRNDGSSIRVVLTGHVTDADWCKALKVESLDLYNNPKPITVSHSADGSNSLYIPLTLQDKISKISTTSRDGRTVDMPNLSCLPNLTVLKLCGGLLLPRHSEVQMPNEFESQGRADNSAFVQSKHITVPIGQMNRALIIQGYAPQSVPHQSVEAAQVSEAQRTMLFTAVGKTVFPQLHDLELTMYQHYGWHTGIQSLGTMSHIDGTLTLFIRDVGNWIGHREVEIMQRYWRFPRVKKLSLRFWSDVYGPRSSSSINHPSLLGYLWGDIGRLLQGMFGHVDQVWSELQTIQLDLLSETEASSVSLADVMMHHFQYDAWYQALRRSPNLRTVTTLNSPKVANPFAYAMAVQKVGTMQAPCLPQVSFSSPMRLLGVAQLLHEPEGQVQGQAPHLPSLVKTQPFSDFRHFRIVSDNGWLTVSQTALCSALISFLWLSSNRKEELHLSVDVQSMKLDMAKLIVRRLKQVDIKQSIIISIHGTSSNEMNQVWTQLGKLDN